MNHVKSGALIAIAAGTLFAAACSKEEKSGDQPAPAKTDPVKTTEPTPAEVKPDPAAGTTADPAKPDPAAAGTGEKVAMVDCYGVNECKGQGTCKTEKHGCGGQNECKGQGVLKMPETECSEKGGKVTQRY